MCRWIILNDVRSQTSDTAGHPVSILSSVTQTDFCKVTTNIGSLIVTLIGNFLSPESSVPLTCHRHSYTATFPRR